MNAPPDRLSRRTALVGLAAVFGLLACTVLADSVADVHLRVTTAPGGQPAFEPGYQVAPAHVRVSLAFRATPRHSTTTSSS